ncbi:MAG: hypothetical protein EON58_22205, partial [Alphaproteobacteria bacterium]
MYRAGLEPAFRIDVYDAYGASESQATILPPASPARAAASLGEVNLPKELVALRESRLAAILDDRTSLTDPESRDPLDFEVSACLQLYTKAKGYRGIVGCVPDALIRGIEGCIRGSTVDLDEVGHALAESGCECLARGDMLVIR